MWLLNLLLSSLIRVLIAAEGLQRIASCHQPHMLPTEELFGNTYQRKNTSRKQDTR